jgi:signal peptidase I
VGRALIYALAGFGGLIVVAVIAFKLVGGTYRIPSESMVPTLEVDSRVAVLNLGGADAGDIVVVQPPAGAQSGECGSGTPPAGQMCAKPTPRKAVVKFIQRVVAVGGDRISMRAGRVIRNGKAETTKGLGECPRDEGCNFPREITVPPGHLFLLGDNRGASDD